MSNLEELENREVSWLSFNQRVLQEATDVSNPVVERMRFLGIFSNNRDEFFRVRIASVTRMLTLGKKTRRQLYNDPEELLVQLASIFKKQERLFLRAYTDIVKELKQQNVHLVDHSELSESQKQFALNYFKKEVRSALVPLMLTKKSAPELTDKSSYLAVKMEMNNDPLKNNYALIEVPSAIIPRFLELPAEGKSKYVMYLDDVIRLGLSQIFKIFPYKSIEAFAVRMTRDAELDLDDDLDESLMDKLSKSISKRRSARPVRFVHDSEISDVLLEFLKGNLKLTDQQNVVPSGRYHNLRDLMNFPNVGNKSLVYKKWVPTRHPELNNKRSLLDIIEKKDILLNYPYQAFSHTIDILREAAIDPTVSAIQISMYRIAKNSKIVNALINASKNGKLVTAVIELRARFDEEHNMAIARSLQENGVKVIFGVEGLKVHCKLIVITRKKRNKVSYIAHIGTGNFHEKNSEVYTDLSLWTTDQKISKEVFKLFDFFNHNYKKGIFRELIVSPFNVRRKIQDMIDHESKNAQNGKKAYIILKLNNLVDPDLIKRLYAANDLGVRIQLIVRGICSLRPGVKGLSENIEVTSILDRYLEHSRIMIFGNNGDERIFISSADWMGRNLDGRIEVATPIYDESIKKEIRRIVDLMLKDNTKARIIGPHQRNGYKVHKGKRIQSQKAIYEYYVKKMNQASE
jgi:polyphosphate kinase